MQIVIIDDLPEKHANQLREVEDKQEEAKVVCGLSFRQVISHIVSCRKTPTIEVCNGSNQEGTYRIENSLLNALKEKYEWKRCVVAL